jgi:glycosidase
MGNNIAKLKLAYMFQFAYPGMPAIYYGDEIGLVGGKDPGCRGAFLWDETTWNNELREFIKQLIRLRKERVALRRGEFVPILNNSNPNVYAFGRSSPEGSLLVAMNPGPYEISISINVEKLYWEAGKTVTDLIDTKKQYTCEAGGISIKLPAYGGIWLG